MPLAYITDRAFIVPPLGETLEAFWARSNPPGTPLPMVHGTAHVLAAGLVSILREPVYDAEVLRWQTIVGFGFTHEAAAYLYQARFRYGTTAELGGGAYAGLASPDGAGSIVMRVGATRDEALHELLHLCWPRVAGKTQAPDGTWSIAAPLEADIDTAFMRVIGADTLGVLARRAFVGSGGTEPTGIRAEHQWVRLGVELAGNIGLLDGYELKQYYERVFTGYPLV